MRISVELNQKETKRGRALQLVFVKNGRARLALGHHVLAKQWDARKQRMRFGTPNEAVINAHIGAQMERARGLVAKDPGLTPYALRDAMRLPDGAQSFAALARRDLKETPPDSYFTQRQRASTIGRFEEWAGAIGTMEITPQVMERYRRHMLERGCAANTAAGQLKAMKTIYRRVCRSVGEQPIDILEGCKATERYVKPPSRLNAEEVARLITYAETAKGWKRKATHMWLFSFLSAGIRWGDLCRMRMEHIHYGRVESVQKKTNMGKNVVLHPYAAKIADMHREGQYLFGIAGAEEPSDQRIAGANVSANKALKDVAKACGITKRLHTHNARHSFAELAMDAQLDDRAIQQAMGISDKIYKHYKGRIRPDRVDDQVSSVLSIFDPKGDQDSPTSQK